MQVVRRIAEEKENSQIVPSKPRTELQRVRLHGLYELLIVLRIILTLNLQTGWIHQDELSNSIEVVAGDYFDLQVFKPDGFNSTRPTQSMVMKHATIYFPYVIFNYFLSYTHPVGKEKVPNTKLLLLIPRLFHLALSFLVDYILVKFCRLNDPTRSTTGSSTDKVGGESKESAQENHGESNTTNTREEPVPNETNNESPNPTTAPTSRSRRRRRRAFHRDPDHDPDLTRDSSEEPQDPTTPASTTTNRPKHGRRRKRQTNLPPPPPRDPSPPPPPPTMTLTPGNSSTIRLVTLASSQVLLVFAPRSHPSSLNLTLFATLLYLVSSSFHDYDAYIPLLERYAGLPKSDGVGRVHALKEMKASGYSHLNRVTPIALLTVLGVWNDPEFFLSYAVIPLFFYMQRGISHRLLGMKYFHGRIFTFLTLCGLFSLPLILWDSVYHGRVGWEDFKDLNFSPDSFVVVPVNYFATKTTSQFRDWWGYLQILGLYLVVFNVLGVMGLVSFLKELYDVVFAEWRNKPNLDSHWTFLNCSLFLPLFFLIQAHGSTYSVFDLTPLIFPLVYMHGHKIPLASRFSSQIGLTWFGCNFVGILYFGYLAQGGILTSFLDLSDNITPIRFNDTQIDITFSQMTAIPPTFTLAIPTTWKTLLPVGDPNDPNPLDPGGHDFLPDSNPLDLSTQTEDFHYNFHHVGKPPRDPLDLDLDQELPPTLYKTVLTLEQSSKVRVYHTGYSPLPMSHLERDLSRLVLKQEEETRGRNLAKKQNAEKNAQKTGKKIGKDPEGTSVSFLLIPYLYGREGSESFKSLKLIHVKTYWNHVFINLFPESDTERSREEQRGWKSILSRNCFHFGLSLYKMELEKDGESGRDGLKKGNNTKIKAEDGFAKYFQFHDAFYDFCKWAGNIFTMVATTGLFFTSYLVYLT